MTGTLEDKTSLMSQKTQILRFLQSVTATESHIRLQLQNHETNGDQIGNTMPKIKAVQIKSLHFRVSSSHAVIKRYNYSAYF